MKNDTICAIATATGGGVGIVRISGPLSKKVAQLVCGYLPTKFGATFRKFVSSDGEMIDYGICLYFPQPKSFTGEDVLELQGHGGHVVMDLLLSRVLELGIRIANPGEFSERAFINGKLDLIQAEAIADLISSETIAAARAALKSLCGHFSEQVNYINKLLIDLRTDVEGSIDFSEDIIINDDFISKIDNIQSKLNALLKNAKQGQILRDGLKVVITGQPNVGKSSLFNKLVGYNAAIVTALPGTTRDLVKESIVINNILITIYDTAGLYQHEETCINSIEVEGIRRAQAIIKEADHIFMVIDDSIGFTEIDKILKSKIPLEIPTTIIFNKIDVSGNTAKVQINKNGYTEIFISTLSDAGINLIKDHLLYQTNLCKTTTEDSFIARLRHIESLERANNALNMAKKQVKREEIFAEYLLESQNALAELTGKFTTEDLLTNIFSRFCIGK